MRSPCSQRATVRGARAGFTLLELMMAISILAVVMVGTGLVGSTAVDVYGVASTRSEVDMRTRRALERVSEELTLADPGQLLPSPTTPLGISSLTFRKVLGQTAGVADLGPLQELAFEMAVGEADNGVDDDGDGLVDEHRLVLRRNLGAANEREIVLCSDVREFLGDESENGLDDDGNGLTDEPGFLVRQTGAAVEIFLTTEGRTAEGAVLSKTLRTTVRMRNYSE